VFRFGSKFSVRGFGVRGFGGSGSEFGFDVREFRLPNLEHSSGNVNRT